MAKNGDLSSMAKNSGERMRSKAMSMMEPGWADMPSKTNALKRTQPAPAQQANAAQKNRQNGSPSAQPTPYKKGGKVHDDAAEDKKLFGKLYAAAEKKEPKGMKKGGKWIAGAVKKPGALHRELGVPMGEKIPKGKIDKAANSSNPMLAKRANFAKTVSKFANGGAVPRGKVAKYAMGGQTPAPPPRRTNDSDLDRPFTGGAPMQETNSPDPAANARAAAMNAAQQSRGRPTAVAPPPKMGGSVPPPIARPTPGGITPQRPAPVDYRGATPVRTVAPMPPTASTQPPAGSGAVPSGSPMQLASQMQAVQAAGGLPAAGPTTMPRPYAMGGAAKIRKDVMTPAGKPIAQPKRGSPAWK